MSRKTHLPRKCFVWCCPNRIDMANEDLRFFRMTKIRAPLWLRALGRDPKEVRGTCNIVCSWHFKNEDFIKEGSKTLKKDAVPTLLLGSTGVKDVSDFKMHEKPKTMPKTVSFHLGGIFNDSNKENVEPSTSTDTSYLNLSSVSAIFPENTNKSSTTSSESSNSSKKRKLPSSTSDSEGLRGSPKRTRSILRTYHNYALSPRKLREKLRDVTADKNKMSKKAKNSADRIKRMEKKVFGMQDVIKQLKNQKFTSDNALEVIEKLSLDIPFLLIKRHVNNSKKGKITREQFPEELRKFAMTLQFYSAKAYNYVRKTFNLALPSPSTIRSWMSNVKCEPGFCQSAFDTLKQKVYDDQQAGIKTICNLVLDEMAIKKQIDYVSGQTWGYVDLGTNVQDDTMSCATEALVLMVVSLNSHWKLPIAYFFIKSLTSTEKANIVTTALQMLHDVGVIITSLTCDGPSAHFSMAEKLGAEIGDMYNLKPYFKHPCNETLVNIIFDACHMIKLLRNNWGSLGKLFDGDGNLIDFNLIKELYNVQEAEMFRFGNKLKLAHLEWQKQKMKVNLAAQTLSTSVADALEFLMIDIKHPSFQHAAATIKFIRYADRLFDLCNSRNQFGKRCHTPFKVENELYWRPILEESLDYLRKLTNEVNTPLFLTKNKTPVKGFIITGMSLLKIYENYVKADGAPLKYLLTYKLSQDHLELFFCSIRFRNGFNNNPTAFQFYHCFKRLLMNHDIKSVNGNCTMQDATNILKVSSNKKNIKSNITAEDILMFKKYNISYDHDVEQDHEYIIPNFPDMTILSENVVVYISGFVVKSLIKKIKCMQCISSLHNIIRESVDDTGFLLLNRKSRGGLLKPSKDVIQVCLKTEVAIRNILINKKIPSEKKFVDIFIHQMTMKIYEENKLFQNMGDHILENIPGVENHIHKLLNLIIATYSKIRFYSICKKQTETVRGELVRKTYSKLILFNHQ